MEERIIRLEKLVNALINSINKDKFYNESDKTGMRKTESENSMSTNENSLGVLDLADLSDENSIAIEDLAEMIDDLEARVEALESKEEE